MAGCFSARASVATGLHTDDLVKQGDMASFQSPALLEYSEH